MVAMRFFPKTGALLTMLAIGCGTVLAAQVTQDPLQGDGGVSPFYVWTDEVPDPSGTMLREEALPEDLVLASASEGRRILYTSTDGIDRKSPSAAPVDLHPPSVTGWARVRWARRS